MGNWSPYWKWYGLFKHNGCQVWNMLWKVIKEKKYGLFNSYIMIDDHGYDGNYINCIIDLTGKGIGIVNVFHRVL